MPSFQAFEIVQFQAPDVEETAVSAAIYGAALKFVNLQKRVMGSFLPELWQPSD